MLARHDLAARKRLGQHFLADPNIVDKIVGLVGGTPGDRVLEVGVGTATLTCALAAAGYRVLGYEVDPRLRPIVAEVTAGVGGVEVRFEDALRVDFESLEGRWRLVANLPYNVGTPLFLTILRTAPAVIRFVVMLQREVADRLVASPGSGTYGLPSVVAALHADLKRAFTVPPQVFVPPPAVDSAVVVGDRRLPADPDAVERAIELAAAAFGQRRKKLRTSLSRLLPDPDRTLTAAGVDPASRAEQVTPEQYLRLAGEQAA